MLITTVGDIRKFIEPITDECTTSPIEVTFGIVNGEGHLDICASKSAEAAKLAGVDAVVNPQRGQR